MNRDRIASLGLAVFGLILVTFLIRGVTRLVVGERLATLLVAPLGIVAAALALYVVAAATLSLLSTPEER